MFNKVDIKDQLLRLSSNTRSGGDQVLSEAKRILKQDLFTESNILEHLTHYNQSIHSADEEELDADSVFSIAELKKICTHYRLKFLDSTAFKEKIPYEAVLKVKHHNQKFGKDLKDFKVLALAESFVTPKAAKGGLLFVKTNYDNYYLVHQWGDKLKWYRKLRFWHMREFENLFATIIFVTLIITMSLPISLITLDPSADYWSGYRAAAFFHLLIFNMGVTVYTTFAFSKNFSSTIWNRTQDFD